jgi:glycosyltransferase involved in cell wall biosynthesis
MKKKLAIVTSHPIQYNAPVFSLLAQRGVIAIKVFYTWSQAADKVFDPGFGKVRAWDIPLLDGYEHSFVTNIAKEPGSHHFRGINNPGLISAIEEWEPDAVLLFGWAFQSHLKCLRYFKNRRPVFFRGDSTLLNETGGLGTALRRVFLKWVYRHIDIAFYVGEANKAYFLKHGVRASQLRKAPHAVDNHRFSKITEGDKERLAALKEQLAIASNDFVLLFAGKIEPVKNPFFMVHLAERLSDPQIKFLIVGNGVLEGPLKEAAKRDARIKFLDFQNQSGMPLIYRLGNVFVLPSISETWGLGANEAMACGLPVMLSDKAGGAVDLVIENENGIVIAENDLDKAVSYVQRLKGDPVLYGEQRRKACEQIQQFSFENIARVIEEELAGRKAFATGKHFMQAHADPI